MLLISRLMAAKKLANGKEPRVSRTFSGLRVSTLNWLQETADAADLPVSKYLSLLLDAIKSDAEELKGGGGNRTRQLLANWFSESGRQSSQRKAAA